jgi:rhamnogalacturonan endolyase
VTVTAGGILQLNSFSVANDPSATAAIWRIGNWDGSPVEFRNGSSITTMHPQDPRLSSWAPGTYVVGTSGNSSFPCYQWKDVNGSQAIQFTLTAAQAAAAHTVRVGITVAYSGARPKISVNSWSSSNPAASTQPSTRSLTVGSYRGNNTTYTFSVPASAFVTGTNTLTLVPISGSGSTVYLSAGYSIDCVDFY